MLSGLIVAVVMKETRWQAAAKPRMLSTLRQG
jgi:hypothetical protein